MFYDSIDNQITIFKEIEMADYPNLHVYVINAYAYVYVSTQNVYVIK